MMNPRSLVILVIILLVVSAGAGWFIYKDTIKSKINIPFIESSKNDNQDTDADGAKIEDITDVQSGDQISSEEAQKNMPDLNKEIVVKGTITESQKIKLLGEIGDIRAKLKEDYDNLENWLQLGLLYKSIEDYGSAAEAWKFATLIRPKDATAFHNLGDLYRLYVPNYPLSEQYFKKAISLQAHPFFYEKLYELYRYSYKEKADLADDILIEGLKAIPNDLFLLTTLGQYYMDIGRKEDAIVYFKKVLEVDPANQAAKTYLENLER